MSEFSKLVLVNIHKKFGEVNLESQELWVKIVPMIKNEYQIIRSTVTQSMKNVFLGKYTNNINNSFHGHILNEKRFFR